MPSTGTGEWLQSWGDQDGPGDPASAGGACGVGRSPAGLDVPRTQRRELRRSARLSRRRRRAGPSRHAVLLRLRRPDAGLPAAVHLSTVRCAGVLSPAPAAVRVRRVLLADRHHGRALRRGAGEPAAVGAGRRRPAHRAAVDRGRDLDRATAQHVRLRPGQRDPGAGRAVRRLQQPVVALGSAGRPRRGRQTHPGGHRAVLPRHAPVGSCDLLGRGVPGHRRAVDRGDRPAGALLLHRSTGRRPPDRADRDVVQPVLARRDLPHPRPRRRIRPAGAGRDRGVGGAGRAGVAGPGHRRRSRPARLIACGAVVRAADLADLVDPPLGVVAAVDDLAHPRSVAGPAGRPAARLGLAGAHPRRGAVAAELRPADDLADRPPVVSGLGRADLHRGDAGHSGLDRR